MIRFYLILLLAIQSGVVLGQDIIVLKTGEEIQAKVLEIGPEMVKYRKHSNLEGPLYSVEKTKIFMIKYENGEKEVFEITEETKHSGPLKIEQNFIGYTYYNGYNEVSKQEFVEILRGNAEAYNLYKNGSSLVVAGNIIGLPSAAILGWELGSALGSGGDEINSPALIVGGIGTIIGVIMMKTGESKKIKATNLYNGSKTQVSLNVHASGLGVSLTF